MKYKIMQKGITIILVLLFSIQIVYPTVVYAQEKEGERIVPFIDDLNYFSVLADDEIDIDETHFPDSVFRTFLIKRYGNTLSKSEIDGRTTFTLSQSLVGGKINDLKGIEYFTALKELDCRNNNLTSLDVSEIPTLENLNCYNNKIVDLKFGNNTSLKYLDCSSNQLDSLNASSLTGLIKLNCERNQLHTINIDNLDNLTELNCWQNQLTRLNTESNIALKTIYCSDNPLNTIDVSKNLVLEKLECDGNQLRTLDVTKNNSLGYLSCTRNQLTSLDVSYNGELWYLTCHENQLKSLDVTANVKLKTLSCYFNKLLSLDLSQNTVLTTFNGDYQRYNLIATTDAIHLSNIDTHLDGTKITNIENAKNTGDTLKDFVPGIQVRYTYQCNDNFSMRIWLDIYGENGWKDPLSINGWQYGDTPNLPYASSFFGDVTFTYSNSEDGIYTHNVPSTIGTWYVKATVDNTNDYTGLEAIKKFTISQATNKWVNELDINGWHYGEHAKSPTASSQYGDVIFTYSNSKFGPFTSNVPSNAGTWYIKATVPESSTYTGLEVIKEFVVLKANNEWTDDLYIVGWTYSEQEKAPYATSKYGNVKFTYSQFKNGSYTDIIPTEAGTWYVKASVAKTDNYEGLETLSSFTIEPKNADNHITVPDIKSNQIIDNLVIMDGNKKLINGIDYDIKNTQNGDKVVLTIIFKGNYTGTIIKTYDAIIEKPKDKIPTHDLNFISLFMTLGMISFGNILFILKKMKRY